jgi:hypothetical protein
MGCSGRGVAKLAILSGLTLKRVSTDTGDGYAALRRLGEFGRGIERRRTPDPYPRASGPVPSLQELRGQRGEIERVASRRVTALAMCECSDRLPAERLGRTAISMC